MAFTLMAGVLGCGSPFQYEKYVSRDTLLNVTMDKLVDWTFRETRGADTSYIQVSFLPPASTMRTGISLTLKDAAHLGTKDDLEAVVADLLKKRGAFSAFKLEEKQQGSLLGEPAVVLRMTYKAIMDLKQAAPLIPQGEKIMVARVKGLFYFFRYQNVLENYAQLEPAFDHMAKSMCFKSK